MKTLLTFLSSTAVLSSAVVASGCAFDAAVAFSIVFASGLAGLGVADYGRKPDYRTATAKTAAPARLSARRPRTSAGFASVIVFETTCA